MTVPRPQDTGCTTIEIDVGTDLENQGITNGIVSMITTHYDVQYDEDRDAYVVSDY